MQEIEYPHFLSSEIPQGQPQTAQFHIVPVPYERTVSYGSGAAKGPSAILQASAQLEVWDGCSRPADLGIYTHVPVNCGGTEQEALDSVATVVSSIVDNGATPIVLGGEHTVTGGVIRGLLDAGVQDIGVVQIDAHADLYDAYEGNPLSHASVMKRVVDLGIPLFQLGVRAVAEVELQTRQQYGVHAMDADVLVPQQINQITLPANFPSNVFFTLDVDGVDPSVFPATGTPVPGGLSWYQTLNLFESVAKQRKIIGFDIMELAPIPEFHAYDFAAAMLVYKLMGIVQRHR